MPLTDVTPLKEKDVHKTCQETGIFVTQIKLCSKKNYTYVLFTMCLLVIMLSSVQQCLATVNSSTALNANVYKKSSLQPPAPYECLSLELINDCKDFYKLQNCTVITGYLSFAHLPLPKLAKCNVSEFQFVNLREITDFLIIHETRNMTSIKSMFPNLTVIRGRKLLLNYALVITKTYDLERIEFKSLIALQRGNVFLDGNRKLCYLEKINWNRLTLGRGKNNIFLDEKAHCPERAKCSGCKRDSCWSNDVCQKLENDSVLSLMQDTSECHRLCLGGCYNQTRQGCVVCKTYSDHGSCLDKCPKDKYTSNRYMRCYTREECINKSHFIYKNTCVEACPPSYYMNKDMECVPCRDGRNCTRVCTAGSPEKVFSISNLMNAEEAQYCVIINATVLVNINEYVDQDDLASLLKNVRQITGLLKINRSPYLTSLKLFQNLEKIHGLALENKLYALIIYNNKDLSDLWTPKEGFEIVNGGLYIHANDKLCNRHIRQFREKVKHDRSLDSFQTSDQEVLCSPATLNINVQVLSSHSIKFYWPKEQTSTEVEIIYRPLKDNELLTEHSELDTEVCKRINWRRELKFSHELENNSTHFSYIVHNLEPHTRYACLVKTFNGEDDTQDARSEIKFTKTLYDIPKPPKIFIKSKLHDTLQIEFAQENIFGASQVVDYYILEVYDKPDNKKQLDTRDYCEEPIMIYKDYSHEDYDDCCSRREEERKDQTFLTQLQKDFSCSLDSPEYCHNNDLENNLTRPVEAILRKRFEAWETNYTISSLESFHLYTIQLQACNHAGCSSYSILSTRTNYSAAADEIYNFTACKMLDDYEYRVHFFEPKRPNGYVTSYALHFRDQTGEYHKLVCITRLEHERNNYLYTAHYNSSFSEAAVRVHSLGHHSFIGWINITTCSPNIRSYNNKSIIIIILVCAVLIGSSVWITYKRRSCVNIHLLRSYVPLEFDWTPFVFSEPLMSDDGQILMENFETVRFRNRRDTDTDHLMNE